MADDTRGNESTGNVPATGTLSTKKKAIVLGPDGKPCRTCNTLTDFLGAKKSTKKAPPVAAAPPNCPPDVEELGRASWTLLHSIAATYPEQPSFAEQQDVSQFMGLFSRIYPCWSCAADFREYIAASRVRAESRDEFGRWLCEAHNEVNRKLGKREFDCTRWQERWRDGWRDGSCG
ncbi:ERV/ALR sulfhydryl oxidase domain-containing protein [Calycina marina]|uniref:Sulfhydryl oxidase n=1 Tax=Calycina marina TaxID=1763456 RepID=A0A9P7ZCS5_9HELO|nr:ERV/ALR sulfhydryl oxidase domain-containing protein [Calycina marina]